MTQSFALQLSDYLASHDPQHMADTLNIPQQLLSSLANGSQSPSEPIYNLVAAYTGWASPDLLASPLSNIPGYYLKLLRIAKHLTLDQAALLSGIDIFTLSNIEHNCQNSFTPELIANYSAALKKSYIPAPHVPSVPEMTSWYLQGKLYHEKAPIISPKNFININTLLQTSRFASIKYNGKIYTDFRYLLLESYGNTGLSQHQISKATGLCRSTIQTYIAGRSARMDCYNKLAAFFDWDMFELRADSSNILSVHIERITTPRNDSKINLANAFLVERTKMNLTQEDIQLLWGLPLETVQAVENATYDGDMSAIMSKARYYWNW